MTTYPAPADRRAALDELLDPLRIDLKIAEGALRRMLDDAKSTGAAVAEDLRLAIKQLDADTRAAVAQLDVALAFDREHYLNALHELLDALRARLELIRVRAELARMDVRDEVTDLVATAEHAWAEAGVRLDEAQRDADSTFDALRAGLEETMAALRSAVQAAWAAMRTPSAS